MTRALFIADQFSDANRSASDRHPGGAELTDEAAIRSCPFSLETRACSALEQASSRFFDDFDVIVLGNAGRASPGLLQRIARTGRHVLFEHDLRACQFRGNFPVAVDPMHRTRQRCWCPHLDQRELFDRTLGTIFLTQLQERYYRNNPYFACRASRILGSSLFLPERLEVAAQARPAQRQGTCVFASPHAIKGHREALAFCAARGITPLHIKSLSPNAVLETFASSERFVYLPIGPEWAGRMVVEARLLGCEVVASALVGVTGEPFWAQPREAALKFLLDGPRRFWNLVEELLHGKSPASARSTSAVESGLDMLAKLLRAAPSSSWPGRRHGELPPPRTYPAW